MPHFPPPSCSGSGLGWLSAGQEQVGWRDKGCTQEYDTSAQRPPPIPSSKVAEPLHVDSTPLPLTLWPYLSSQLFPDVPCPTACLVRCPAAVPGSSRLRALPPRDLRPD